MVLNSINGIKPGIDGMKPGIIAPTESIITTFVFPPFQSTINSWGPLNPQTESLARCSLFAGGIKPPKK